MFAASATISMARCVELPLPALAQVNSPGLALARSRNCATEVMPLCLLATSMKGVFTTGAT